MCFQLSRTKNESITLLILCFKTSHYCVLWTMLPMVKLLPQTCANMSKNNSISTPWVRLNCLCSIDGQLKLFICIRSFSWRLAFKVCTRHRHWWQCCLVIQKHLNIDPFMFGHTTLTSLWVNTAAALVSLLF